ncbi:MAG TPA: N-acetylmuramoyl-L-alanine amidase [Candidatus Baltobacteraceae bacterium]
MRAGRVALLLMMLAWIGPAQAQFTPDVWFAGTQLIFDHAQARGDAIAVGTQDTGLLRFLARVGATVAFQPGQRYVVITSSDHRTITFTLGDPHYSVESERFTAPFSPYAQGDEAFVPLFSLAKALYVAPVMVGAQVVLQPQIGALDVHNVGDAVEVRVRGATALHFRRVADTNGALQLLFTGVASALDQSRIIGAPGLSQITLVAQGTPRSPTTSVAFYGPADGVHVLGTSASPNELTLLFAPAGTPLAGDPIPDEGVAVASAAMPVATPDTGAVAPQPATPAAPAQTGDIGMEATPLPSPSPATATVTEVDETPTDQTFTVRIAVDGPVAYEWHRLLDGRWYIDLQNAVLGLPPRDDTPASDAVTAVRLRQLALVPVPVVRVALSLPAERTVDVAPAGDSVTLTIGPAVSPDDDALAARTGAGSIGDAAVATTILPAQTPLPSPQPLDTGLWKFGPRSGSRLIVIDPGHGGSDTGAQQNGLVEKDLTHDISERLRTQLVARGWSVKLTRDTDVDVFAPNDSAHDELQARCDIANNLGARIFVSIHVNSFTSSDLNGTTTYYYKGQDLPLAQAIHRRLIAALTTQDDGVRKDNFYVIHHTTMPAVLIETAFMSNTSDAALLRSPAFLQKVADAVADGVSDYAGAPPPPQTSMDMGQ